MRATSLISAPLWLLGLWGCASPEKYGPAGPLTEAQQDAVRDLVSVAAASALAAEGEAAPPDAIEVVGQIARLSDRALLRGTPTALGDGATRLLDPGCARGTPRDGFVYDDCEVPGGKLGGQVIHEAPVVRYELTVPAAPDARYTLLGDVTVTGARSVGHVEFDPGNDEVFDPISGSSAGGSAPGGSAVVMWDAEPDVAAGCFLSGTAEIQVQANGGEEEARFLFRACDDVVVQNSAD